MFSFKRKPRGTALRAALLAGAAIAAFGAGGVSPGAASAANCEGANEITLAGSTLQKVAQTNIWGPAFCSGGGALKYEGIGSQEGLKRWGANGGAFASTTTIPLTDDAPNPTQIEEIKTAAGGGSQGLIVIPVAQAAIAVIEHPPTGCTVPKITTAELESVFGGSLTDWSEFSQKSGGACTGSITRVVRNDGSGTTYVFKHFLDEINSTGPVACTGKTWAELGEASPNTEWPEGVGCGGTAFKETGGGALATYVNANESTIGYVSLSDAAGKASIRIAEIQNNTGTASYGFPSTTTPNEVRLEGRAKSNCDLNNKIYNLPKTFGGTQITEWKNAAADNVDWSHVFGTSTMVRELLESQSVAEEEAKKAYPICGLTYALGLTKYETPGFTLAHFETARELLKYEVNETQQNTLVNEEKGYGRLFTTPGPLEAAAEAVKLLAF